LEKWRRRHETDCGGILIKVDGNGTDTKIIYSVCVFFYGEDDGIGYFLGAKQKD